MMNEMQINRMLGKLTRFEEMLNPYIFEKVGEVSMSAFPCGETQHHSIPDDNNFKPIEKGYAWGGEYCYCWFKGDYKVADELDGKDIFLYPHITGYEAMLWVNNQAFGTFCTKIVYTGHGNHYCDMIKKNAKAGENIAVALEYYAGHKLKGTQPFDENEGLKEFNFNFNGADICVKNDEIAEFYFDLKTLNQLAEVLPKDSFERATVIKALIKVHENVYYSIENVDKDTFIDSLRAAKPYMKEALSNKNSSIAPFGGLIGHSHMDTAWLWHIPETVKKCARTYANQLNLMQQYPEYTFVQSSSYHSEVVRRNYPELFERIQEKVKEKRYEPNGGVWVECDCNITSGESMIRQFLWGQRFTRKYFDYTSNCFWLPDTFGYSAAIPQIMKGCGVDYFLTTKISWNDTNVFPYDTFYWQGIDGTKVFTHFNTTHSWPDPKMLKEAIADDSAKNTIKQKTVSDKRLIAYGFGDGGGGPQFEMIEMTRRVKDMAGLPKTEHVLVGSFMKELEQSVNDPCTYTGELYLELHRGTLTNQHTIKRNNRKAELSLRNLEYVTVNDAVKKGEVAKSEKINPMMETLLVNQFHDILPGTCINRAHVQSRKEMGEVIETSNSMIKDIVSNGEKNIITLINTLSFDRNDVVVLDYTEGKKIEGSYRQQVYTNLNGEKKMLVYGINVPAFSSVQLNLVPGNIDGDTLFKVDGNNLETPFAKVVFDDRGFISSFTDKSNGRELKGEGYNLNTFLVAEDVPAMYDNWDVDADIEMKYKDTAKLKSREVVSNGEVAYIIRSEYQITAKSSIKQDMIFFADSAEVRFDTVMDWNDEHRFLKSAFDTSVLTDFVRNEIQFGYLKRPTTRNTTVEQAKFEILNHKYTDLSENRYGVAILNDCKYAISTNGGQLRLSLHKGGCRPDDKGDKGMHSCVYSFLPHNCGFNVNSVVKPAYELNIPCIVANGRYENKPLATVDADNIITETIKPCEDNERAFIVRMYEAEGTYTPAKLTLFEGAKAVYVTNMLEEVTSDALDVNNLLVVFNPFEIKTFKIIY